MDLHDVEAMLAQVGFTRTRSKGSHRQYHDERGRRVTLTTHGRRVHQEHLDNLCHALRRMGVETDWFARKAGSVSRAASRAASRAGRRAAGGSRQQRRERVA